MRSIPVAAHFLARITAQLQVSVERGRLEMGLLHRIRLAPLWQVGARRIRFWRALRQVFEEAHQVISSGQALSPGRWSEGGDANVVTLGHE